MFAYYFCHCVLCNDRKINANKLKLPITIIYYSDCIQLHDADQFVGRWF